MPTVNTGVGRMMPPGRVLVPPFGRGPPSGHPDVTGTTPAVRLPGTCPGHPGLMSESSTQHADVAWPHPGSEAARVDGRYAPDPEDPRVPEAEDDAIGAMRD